MMKIYFTRGIIIDEEYLDQLLAENKYKPVREIAVVLRQIRDNSKAA